ncbi:MAG TPA: four helix bundle protein [Vicinamibacterales bacterium]
MRSSVVSFRDLKVWQLGMDLAVEVYSATRIFPASERFGLCSQMQRASVSIPSNVAEGHARREGAYLNHVKIALGSQAELGTEVELALRLGYLSSEKAESLVSDIDRVRQLLFGLKRSLERERQSTVVAVTTLVILMGAVLF